MLKNILLLLFFIIPLNAQLVPFNGYINSDAPISGSYLIEVIMTNSNNQAIWSENFYNHDIVDGYYSLVLGENGTSDLSSVDFNQTLYLNVSIPSLSFLESDIPLYSTFSSIQSIKNQSDFIAVSASADVVSTQPWSWTTLLELDIEIQEEMMIYSSGTVSGENWGDGNRMLQIILYNENYTQWYPSSNQWGDVSVGHNILPAGLYHIQLTGANLYDEVKDMTWISLSAFASPVNNRQESNVRVGPFDPPLNNNLPDPKELLNKIK